MESTSTAFSMEFHSPARHAHSREREDLHWPVMVRSGAYVRAAVKAFHSEIEYLVENAGDRSVSSADLVHITDTTTRLYRSGPYPPLRGTAQFIEGGPSVLYTRGSVDFFSTYPSQYVPRPLAVSAHVSDSTPRKLCEEVLALTKMNWNNAQFDGGYPITLRAARRVGDILKYVDPNARVEPRYSFYM